MKISIVKFVLLAGLFVACQDNPIKAIKDSSVKKEVNQSGIRKTVFKDTKVIADFIKIEWKFFKGKSDLSFNNAKVYKVTKDGKSALMVNQLGVTKKDKENYGFAVALKEGKLYKPFMVKVSKIDENLIEVDYYFESGSDKTFSLTMNKETKSVKSVYSKQDNGCFGELISCIKEVYNKNKQAHLIDGDAGCIWATVVCIRDTSGC